MAFRPPGREAASAASILPGHFAANLSLRESRLQGCIRFCTNRSYLC
jgi:hypothetical protein